MYHGDRFSTSGVANAVPFDIQMIIWGLVDKIKNDISKVDYLQIFHLSSTEDASGNKIQIIEHVQEVPSYSKVHEFNVKTSITEKIYVIHSESSVECSYLTMLFASEY